MELNLGIANVIGLLIILGGVGLFMYVGRRTRR